MLASLAAVLLFAASGHAGVGTPFKITSFVLNKDGTAALQWQGANSNMVVQFTADVAAPHWQPLPGVAWPVNGTSWSGVIPMKPGKGFLRVVTTRGVTTGLKDGAGQLMETQGAPLEVVGTAPIPLKTISLTLIGWHNPRSDQFLSEYRNCIACHGRRTEEVALDGTTPTAHSIMLSFYGQGNDRCIRCHYNGPNYTGPNFLTHSGGSLRKQVNYEINGCTACHAKGSFRPLYDRY